MCGTRQSRAVRAKGEVRIQSKHVSYNSVYGTGS